MHGLSFGIVALVLIALLFSAFGIAMATPLGGLLGPARPRDEEQVNREGIGCFLVLFGMLLLALARFVFTHD